MKQPDDLVRCRVEAGDVWPLVKIAMRTGPGEIAGNCFAAVLLRHDVIDLEWQGEDRLWNTAVLTSPECSIFYKPSQFPIH